MLHQTFPTGVDVVRRQAAPLFVRHPCNVSVCLAVHWIRQRAPYPTRCWVSCRRSPDSRWLPGTAANMFFLMGPVAKRGFGADAGRGARRVGASHNLSAATLGNILGGPVRGAGLLVPTANSARRSLAAPPNRRDSLVPISCNTGITRRCDMTMAMVTARQYRTEARREKVLNGRHLFGPDS